MRIDYVISENAKQVVFTPESDSEKAILKLVEDDELRMATIFRGNFYPCAGGWSRWGEQPSFSTPGPSLIVMVKEPEKDAP